MKPFREILLSALVLPVFAACGGGAGPVPLDAAAALPLDAFRPAPEIAAAVDGLTARCMARLGHDWAPDPVPAARPWESGLSIGLLDAAHAAEYGYRPPPRLRERLSTTDRAVRVAYAGPMPGETAPAGVPDGGCAGEARRALAGPDTSIVSRLAGEAEDGAHADERGRAALDAWSACMSGRGHRYAEPAEAQWQYWPEAVTDVERSLATADVACKDAVGLPATWRGLVGAYQERLAAGHAAELDAVRRGQDAQLAKARAAT
ncbi:hypothetical protein Afil01_16370 [Actinorhabdospora filicis]|uniref:Lipoprotein n=1 Tax=Actinorhabdospora filicis TaxID=1785913 RepID=A0A9W6SIZ6_9ACTN|nr:hypothetical protein [Actinorhabdospora filicis]GLZ76830.1 hypothetical protein Afil01_16370 [Actinorhabdospora filicis]